MAAINVKIQPFAVPTSVLLDLPRPARSDDYSRMFDSDVSSGPVEIRLRDLPVETLTELCDEFVRNVFTAVGKSL